MTPWWVPDAIGPVEQFLASGPMRVLEWGAGTSTVWLAHRAARLRSIEHDASWVERVKALLVAEGLIWVELLLCAIGPAYEQAAGVGPYDLIVIDGRRRVACGRAAVPTLAPGGLLVLDNSERPRYAELCDLLAEWPVAHYTASGRRWRTSIWRRP